MMRCSRNVRLLLAFVAGVCLLGPPQLARADFYVTLSEAGYGSTTVNVTGSSYSLGSFGSFTFNPPGFPGFQGLVISTTSPGTGPLGAQVAEVQLFATNTASSTQTLTVSVSSGGFTAPGGPGSPLLLVNSLATSSITDNGSNASVSFQSGIANVGSTPSVTLTSAGQATSTASLTWPSGQTSYTVTNTLTLTLDSGGSANLDATSSVVAPAPAGAVLAATGLPFLGLVSWRRRRRRKD